MEQNLIQGIVAPAVKKSLDHITKHLGYFICSSKHVNGMKQQMRILENTKVDVKKRMERNTLNNKEIPAGVPGWVIKVETLKQVESISSEGYGCLNIKMRYRAGKKACEATERIKDLTTENNAFVWTDAPIPTGRVDSKSATSTPSSHGVNFKSRDRSFNEALKWLQQDNNESQVIALCGMGGVGKTTMMEQLITVAKDKKMFDYIVSVVIGRTPNMHSIQNDIVLHIASEGLVEATIPVRADRLREKFKKHLEEKKKRILFILDDVWKKIELKDIGLTSPLPNGLKLFLTSRDSDICRQIAVSAHSQTSFKVVEVEVLTEEEAQHLFFKITNVSKEDNRYDIGCQIVEKCGRLPLAINIIGTALHSRETHAWNSKLQHLNNNNIDDDLQEVIKISYEYRDEEDKEVLLLCGLFPEDYDIRIEDLTRYAWGLNLFKGVSTLGGARDSTRTCVGNLINAHLLINNYEDSCVKMHDLVLSFVLGVVSKSDCAWIINHGDVTQLAGREESSKRISLTCTGMSEFPQDFKYPNLSLLQLMNGEFSLKFPDDFYENLKSLQVIAYYNMQYPLLPRSLHCSTNLKSLCLYCCKLMFDISFVGDLVNLEVLSFAHCGIHKLPSAIGKLVKLRLLDLTGCLNLRIDNGVFKNLKKLEELYMRVSSNENVRFTESNIKELAMLSKQLFALEVEFVEKENLFEFFSFEKLDKFKIAIGGCFDSYEIQKDPFVNKLKLVSDCNIDLHNCKIKKLFKKTEHLDLQVKDMIGLEEFHYDRHSFSSLKCLMVYGCSNLKYLFPVCVANGLKKLEILIICECPVLEALIKNDGSEINVVELPQLLELDLYDLPNFTSIYTDSSSSMCALFNSQSGEEDDNIHTGAFQSNLYFHLRSQCEGVKVVFEIDLNNQQPLFPNLKKLRLLYMNDMCHVWKCNNWNKYLLISYSSFHNLTSIEISFCNRIKYLFSPLMAKLLSNLQKIKVERCDDMEEVVSNRDDDDNDEEEMSTTSTTTTFFPHLQSLTFEILTNLTRIGGGGGAKGTKTGVIHDQFKVSHVGVVSWSLCQFSKEIIILYCNGLSSVIPLDAIGQMQKLEVLRVEYCKSLTEVFESQYINGNSGDSKSSININKGSVDIDAISRQSNINMAPLSNLKILVIESCNLLQHVFTFSMLESLKHLEELKIQYCKAMKVIVEKENAEQTKDVVFPRLKLLELQSLPNLEGFFLGMNDFKWPLLEMVKIDECPQMMNFTCGQSTTPALKDIHTSLGRHSLECGLNFHHLKIHQANSSPFKNYHRCKFGATVLVLILLRARVGFVDERGGIMGLEGVVEERKVVDLLG
ncbi:hypothetical protein E3N88_00124 [Mikania micrantha]|uniref:Uncharacterized protein n=1 Tax=Mikania micrantha TaxID=192012 RepID=A0A5N6PZA5_9ASTR|nr:hypothetical protein E3N88_00124 [Mikania micrantha]